MTPSLAFTPAPAPPIPRRATTADRRRALAKRLAPTLTAAALALTYLIVSPPSEDLPAHLLRARLFATEGFGLWNNWWYGGHFTPGYSVLFPPLAAAVTPQIVGAVAAVATAALFEMLAREHFGPDAWLGALWFGAATALDLYTGRLTFALGLLPAMATTLALAHRRDALAGGLAVVTALASPVAALFAALAGAGCAVARATAAPRPRPRAAIAPLAVAAAALVPVLALTTMFPEGGSEPYAFSPLWPILLTGGVALAALGGASRQHTALKAGIVLYLAGNVVAYLIASPVGSNATRLEPLLAGPLAALLFWPRRKAWLLAAVLPLLYIQWQAPVRDVRTSWNDRATTAGYYRPLLDFLARQAKAPFRVEIPFTSFHWEAYEVAAHFALARGWERQLDLKDNRLFYAGALTPVTYERWLHTNAVAYVAVANGPLDYSARREVALIDRGLPYLRLVMHTPDWRVYAVANPTPLAQGAATATAMNANSVSLRVRERGAALVRVRFNPYWALRGVPGCVAPAGQFTRVTARRRGEAKLVIAFSPARVGARSPRCSK